MKQLKHKLINFLDFRLIEKKELSNLEIINLYPLSIWDTYPI
jgi:hypothetical protein